MLRGTRAWQLFYHELAAWQVSGQADGTGRGLRARSKVDLTNKPDSSILFVRILADHRPNCRGTFGFLSLYRDTFEGSDNGL